MKVIITGGGTGGHIYPGIAIADEIRKNIPDAKILFVGAEGKMEAEKVPRAGYPIEVLPIRGLRRKFDVSNLLIPFRLAASLRKAGKILREFKPDIVIGTGGYAASAMMKAAVWQGIPVVIQEQNGYAGLTNKLLAKDARKICVAYPDMERFFPARKIVFTGNPVRSDLLNVKKKRGEGLKFFGFTENQPVLLILGGSLGAASINRFLSANVEKILSKGIQVVWQTGKLYIDEIRSSLHERGLEKNSMLWVNDFIYEMPLAYAAADFCVARAGALTISDLSLCEMPSIFVPSPNVAENHQYKNAMQLVSKDAAWIVEDGRIEQELLKKIFDLADSHRDRVILSLNIQKFAKPNASQEIFEVVKAIIVGK
jgi:UDP-N-acetylglucosamine--N-acetylmuramyl-(pentapeptide) pyrophosphoryl-undecaprenol N-acetylglucosamine transferase